MSEQLVGFRSANGGATHVSLRIDETRALLRVHARWMGRPELDVELDCEHRVLGTHSGALLVQNARCRGETLPLPPSDGALIIEYVRVPSQRATLAGSESLPWSAGRWTDPFSFVLWLHPDAAYDDEHDDPSVAQVMAAIRWIEQPWKLGSSKLDA